MLGNASTLRRATIAERGNVKMSFVSAVRTYRQVQRGAAPPPQKQERRGMTVIS